MSSNSKIFFTKILKSILSSLLFTYISAFILSLQSILSFTFNWSSVLYLPAVFASVSSLVTVISRRYVRTDVSSTNRFYKIARGLSVKNVLLAALCSASAWFLSILNPFCHDEQFWHLLGVGCALTGAAFHYENVYIAHDFHFPIIQTTKYSMFMSKLSEIILKSMKKSFFYTFFIFIPLYAIDSKSSSDGYFIIVLWFSIALILYFLYSFERIVYLNMTERVIFPIMTIKQDGDYLLTALNSDIKIIKSLALFDLYQATIKDAERRKQIFSLSCAGSIPQSWKIIFSYCINNIKCTIEDMANVVKHETLYINRRNIPNARLLQTNCSSSVKQEKKDINKQNILIMFFEKFRIYTYVFGSLDKERTLEEFEITVWCCYILSNLAVVSLKEDEYGVVREQLGQIVSAVLDLKSQLEFQRKNVDSHNLKKVDYFITHVKTCAVMLALHFALYVNDIGLDETQLHSFKKIITMLNN